MVDSVNKIQKLKAIKDPTLDRDTPADETNSVLIPVTVQISFKDPKDNNKEIVFRFDNTETSGRGAPFDGIARVEHVPHRTGTPDNYTETDDEKLDVERPLRFGVVDPKENDPVYGNMIGEGFRLDNRDEADSWPMRPEVYQLFKDLNLDYVRHIVRYTCDNTLDGVPFVDVELIDILSVTDPKRNNQEVNYRITYADRGPDIEDGDDPYKPTFAIADRDLEKYDEVTDPDAEVDPPWRTSPLENIVNHNFAGAIEYEPPDYPPHDPDVAPEMATTVQDDTAIEDCRKFLFSGFFNFPADWPDLPGTFDGGGAWMLLEFGGAQLGVTAGVPSNSWIGVGREWFDTPEPVYFVEAQFWGSTDDIDLNLGNNFYGTPANLDFASGDASSTTAVMTRNFGGRITIGGPAEFEKLREKWNHIAVSFDVNDGDFDDDDLAEVTYTWVWECDAIWHEGPPPVVFTYSWNGPLSDWNEANGIPFPSGIDPVNGDASPVYDIRSNSSPGGIGRWNWGLIPDAVDHPRERIYVLAKEGLLFGYDPTPGHYYGVALTSWPVSKQREGLSSPMRMTLNRGIRKDIEGLSDSLANFGGEFNETLPPTITRSSDGVIVSDRQVAIPRKSQDKIESEGSFVTRIDAPTRLAQYQIWFDKSADIYDPTIADYFTTRFTDPNDSKSYIKPATFTDDDKLLAASLGVDPATLLSRAALRLGKPSIFMKGGPGKQDIAKPPGVRSGGFPQNKGTAEDFVTKNNVNSFSPAVGRILFPTS